MIAIQKTGVGESGKRSLADLPGLWNDLNNLRRALR